MIPRFSRCDGSAILEKLESISLIRMDKDATAKEAFC